MKVSNTLIDKDGKSTVSKKNIVPDNIYHKIGGLAAGILGTAKNGVKMVADEL